MIKSPDVFGPTTYKEEREGFLEFRMKMRSWIGALNPDILAKIDAVEIDRREGSWEMAKLTVQEREMSKKLHSILTSYTRGRPLRTLKQVPQENGFEAWRLLVEEHQPHSRARSLQLLNNVLHYRFDNKKSTQENLLKFEEAIEEYEKSSGDLVAEDMKISIVLGGTEGNMRQHLLLNQRETAKYAGLRQYLLSYEQATRWTTTDLINSGKDHQGQADMDVSRVNEWWKGKGKDKGKSKGKGKGFGKYGKGKGGKGKGYGKGEGQYYKGKGRGKGKGKGRGKGRGRGPGRGGGKGYSYKGKGKGYNNYNSGANLCHYCQKPGHYEANCRLKQRDMQNARNVQEEDEQSIRTQTTAVPNSSTSAASSRTTAAKSTAKPTVRQIAMYHMGDEPENYPEVFELDEDEEELEIEYFGRILRVTEVEEFCLSSGEESETEQREDPLLDWYLGREELPRELPQPQEVLSVRVVGEDFFQDSELHERIEVILDSGADVSLVPPWLGKEGTPLKARPSSIQDAQGKAIKTEGRRMLNLTFFDEQGSFCRVQEAFTVASVINPLMAIGKLFREGWELKVSESEGMCLTDGSSRIPVHLHKNSLATYAYVQTPSRSREDNVCYDMVRTVVQLNKHVQEAVNRDEPGWHNTDSMVMVKHSNQNKYENPSLMFSATHFPYRSTLVREERGWRAVEVSKKYSEKTNPFEEFEDGEKEVVTAISAKPIPLWILGTPYNSTDRADQESHSRDYWKVDLEKGELVRFHVVPRTVLFNPTGVARCPLLLADLEDGRHTLGECIYSTELYEYNDNWRTDRLPLREHFRLPWFGQTRFQLKPEVVEDMKKEAAAEELKQKKEAHYRGEAEEDKPEEEKKDEEMREATEEPPQEVVEVTEESFFYEGVEYSAKKSSLKELQALCREFGAKTTGSKKQLLKRLATATREDRLNAHHKQQREHHQAYSIAPPEEPTEEQRMHHNLTHLPYQPWCPHCVAMKAREDNHPKGLSKPSSSTDSSKPVISFDFCYTSTTGSEQPPAVTLVAVDNWSKAVCAVPSRRKGTSTTGTTHLAESLVHFTTQLGYNSIVLKADNENAAKALKDKVQKIRSSLGLSTTLQESIPYNHESNGAAERAIQTVRRQANTLLDELRERTGLSIPHEHPVVSWAFRHACWLLNRFAVSSSTKRTPQEVLYGYPYTGKLVPFGTVVMAKRLKVKRKGDRIWNAGIFLGKTEQDTWIVAQPDGIHITRSVRPLPEQYDSKRTSSIEVHTWDLNQPLLGSRVLPEKKQKQRPQLSILPPVAEEERDQLENDEAGTDPPTSEDHSYSQEEGEREALEDREDSSEASSMSVQRDRKRRPEVSDDTLLEELQAIEAPTASASLLAAPSEPRTEASKHSLDQAEPDSPSKHRKQVNRAEEVEAYLGMPHDDEVYEAEDEFSFYSEEEEEQEEEDPQEEQPNEQSTKVPIEFFDEEKGPPDVDPAFLQKLDDEATKKEIRRLTKMGVISLVSTEAQEATEQVPFEDAEQEVYKWLTTKLVKDWRFREATGFEAEDKADSKPKQTKRCWQRRARLVAREYKTEGKREDIFSPATSPGITKLVPMVALANQWAIYSVDVKDAFLQVPQRTPCLCRVPEEATEVVQAMQGQPEQNPRSWCWRLGRVLPGQRDASSLWSDFCDGLLVAEKFERCQGVPALYRLVENEKVVAVCIVHVDDLQFAGKKHTIEPILAHLKKKVNLQIEGPLLNEEEYEKGYSEESVKFLKRKYTYQDYELRIASDSKYSKKLTEILKLEKKKPKNSPCTPACQEKDLSQELREEDARTYRSCVGILLYVAHDRPDIQFAVRNLSTAMSKPTERKRKELEHLALYLKGTYDYNVAYTRTTPGKSALRKSEPGEEPQVPQPEEQEHLLEVFSDSDWAGDKQTRKSVSCAMFYLDGAYFYSYSRTQKSIALSSAEAEYMALTGAASESIGLHAAARFLTGRRVQLKAYTDSSACRGITNRQGTGRVKHLQIRLLWLQAAIREGRLSVHSVGTKENTADLGTKPLSTKRVKYLLNMIGMCSSDGRVGEQERAEEDKVQIVRRLEKVMKNKSSMLFALSSLLMQQSEAVNLPLAAAQGPSPQEALEVQPRQGNMSFLEIVVAILMIGLTIYFVVNLERNNKKRETEERKGRSQKSSSSEEEESSESEKSEEKKKKKNRRKRSEAPAAQVSDDSDLTVDKAEKEEESKKEKEELRKKLKEREDQAKRSVQGSQNAEKTRYKELESTLNDKREKAVAEVQEKDVGTWLASLTQKEKEVAKREKLRRGREEREKSSGKNR